MDWVAFGVERRPRTLLDWEECVRLLMPKVANGGMMVKSGGAEASYTCSWLIRVFLLWTPHSCFERRRVLVAVGATNEQSSFDGFRATRSPVPLVA